jgi:hypothetical protein
VLVLGDSQLSFGAGAAMVDLFADLGADCGLAPGASVGVIGVRSSTLVAWTSADPRARSAICDVDPKWKVNAGVYGTFARGDSPYVQIGRDKRFPFCPRDRSPLRAVFREGAPRPGLLVMVLLGNAAERWADSPAAALQDVRAFVADLPPGQPCLFMTSAPPYGERVVRLRQRAQDNLAAAFARAGGHCSFVPGFTAATVRENMGNPANFRRKRSGQVKDPYHPTEAAARRFLSLRRDAICRAVAEQLAR